MSSESEIDTSYGNQMMKGVVFVAVPMALVQASAPYVGALEAQSAEWIMFALLVLMAYGLLLMVTSKPTVQALGRIESLYKNRTDVN